MNKVEDLSLHAMLDAYSDHIRLGAVASPAWSACRLNLVRRLKEVHADLPLSSLDRTKVQSLVDYWRSRPPAKNLDRPVASETARNYILELRRFLTWLDAHPETSWSMPSDFHRLNTNPVRLNSDFRSRIQCRRRYTIDELRLLYQHARGDERLIFLLGLNCGFGAAEMGQLKVEDFHIKSQHRHPWNEERGSVLVFRRPKSNHVGMWPLWPETEKAFEGLMEGRCEKSGHVFKRRDGDSLYRHTSRNPSFAFANLWQRLTNRVSEQHPEFPRLPLGMLRGTAWALLKQHCSGDVVRAFSGHGTAYRDHVYRIHDGHHEAEACQRLREILEPVFEDEAN